jgi:two-component system, cell cycle response regulator CpdR
MNVSSKPHIVVADDEELVRSFLIEILSPGFQITPVESGDAALALLKTGVRVDGMITDFEMSGMDGVELIKYCFAHYPTLSVILLTANPWSEKVQSLALSQQVRIVEKLPTIRDFIKIANTQFRKGSVNPEAD